ncbi:carboxymuconolactone decarboxylase family protein [Streptomyces blastmyceticus]|uniref:carboxymuconolactone decarboxylase family protein n=1 Tax=Streptomyces blastmyceticus TaxID=68180 RepID=UPI0031DC8199
MRTSGAAASGVRGLPGFGKGRGWGTSPPSRTRTQSPPAEAESHQTWKALDPQLKALAVMASAASIGCSWCMDFGYWENHRHGMAPEKLRDVPRWRESEVYTPLERDVMEYAEAMSATPPTVTDELVERLREHLDDAALVELTAMVAVDNLRSRTNAALGLTSQGFRDTCEIPSRER